MTEEGPQNIAYNRDLGRFYDTDTGRFVSFLTGIESLHATETATGPRYYDAYGTRTPNPENLIPAYLSETFVDRTRNGTPASQEVYDFAPADNQYYRTGFFYTDLNGRVHVGFINSAIGQTVDNEVERARMIATVGSQLDIDPNSDAGGSGNIANLLSGYIVHYRMK